MKQPRADAEGAEQQAGAGRARARRRPGESEYFFYLLPEGRGGPRIKKGNCPGDDDPELAIEESSQCEPGEYRIEMRKGGEISGRVYHYTKDDRGAHEQAGDGPDETLAAEFDELDDLDSRIAKTVSAVLDARERRERASTPQLNPLDIAREVEQLAEQRAARERELRESILKEIEARTPKEDPAKAQPQLDPQTQLGVLLLRQSGALKDLFRNAREAFGAVERADEPQGWSDKLIDLARDYAPYVGPVAGPMIGQMIMRGMAQRAGLGQGAQPEQASAALPAGQHAAPAADAQTAALQVFNIAVQDLRRNKRVGRTADALDELATAHPELAGEISTLLSLPPAQVLAQLSQMAGEDLATYSHAAEWVENLAAEVLPDEEGGDDAADAESMATAHNNGHSRASAAPVQ